MILKTSAVVFWQCFRGFFPGTSRSSSNTVWSPKRETDLTHVAEASKTDKKFTVLMADKVNRFGDLGFLDFAGGDGVLEVK